jgi:hypothetical protein
MPINASSTFERLANDRTSFANPNVCVEDGRFVVHFSECIVFDINKLCAHHCVVVRNHPLSGLASFDGIHGRHVCLSAHLYWQFYSDLQGGDGSGEVPSCESACVSNVPEAVHNTVQVKFSISQAQSFAYRVHRVWMIYLLSLLHLTQSHHG